MRYIVASLCLALGATAALPATAAEPQFPICEKQNCLAAHDINGFELGTLAATIVSQARKQGLRVEDVGGGQIKAYDSTHRYVFLFSALRRLSFINYIQDFGRTEINNAFYASVSRRIEKKYGIKNARDSFTGGLHGITYYQPCTGPSGKRLRCQTEALVVHAEGGHYPMNLELHMTLSDRRIDAHDAATANGPAEKKALEDLRF